MHYRAIFKYRCFWLFCGGTDSVAVFWPIFLVIKVVIVAFRLIYCVNDFMTDFKRNIQASQNVR